jgi:circadian clock protein KaiC
VELCEAYIGSSGGLTGSARVAQEALESAEVLTHKHEIERKKREIERKRKALESKIAALHADFDSEESEAAKLIKTEQDVIKKLELDKMEMAASRKTVKGKRATDNSKKSL